MKIRKLLVVFCFSLVLLLNTCESAFAMNTGFSTVDMLSNKKQEFLSNISLSVITEEPRKNTIKCFDVNRDGLVAVGSEESNNKSVLVYSANGVFLYGYTFNCDGSFGVEWDNNDIIIYFVRSDVAASFDSLGNNLELQEIEDTIDNNSYWNHSLNSRQRTVNKTQYNMTNKQGLFSIFSSSYSQIIKTDLNNNVTTVYQADTETSIRNIIIFVAVVLFVLIVVSLLILQFIKLKKGVENN